MPDVWEPLRAYVDATGEKDIAAVAKAWGKAVGLVNKHLTEYDTEPGDVDAAVLEGAIVDCGSEFYYRRDAPFGVTTFAAGDGAVASRVSADPMVRAKVMLEPFLRDRAGFA